MNKLNRIMPLIISLSQSTYFPGHLINDNVLVAFEIIYHLKRKTRGEAALKIDINKAYERVGWKFLNLMLFKLSLLRNGLT